MVKRILHLLLIFSLLNQSVDFDHAVAFVEVKATGYDDIDSVWELVVEQIAGDDKLVSENDDDPSAARDKDIIKDNPGLKYYPEVSNMFPAIMSIQLKETILLPADNIICKGYLFIISPPPDMRL